MSMNEKQRQEWENTLRKLQLLEDSDSIQEQVMANWCKVFMSQTKGNCFFTNEKFIFVSSLGFDHFVIRYNDIKEIGKCRVGVMPMGMYVVAEDTEKAKQKKYKISVMKRDHWLALLSEKAGVNIM